MIADKITSFIYHEGQPFNKEGRRWKEMIKMRMEWEGVNRGQLDLFHFERAETEKDEMVELKAMVEEYAKLQEMLRAIKSRADALRDAIITTLGEGRHIIGGYAIDISVVSRRVMDTKRVKAILTELSIPESEWTKEVTATYLKVKPIQ